MEKFLLSERILKFEMWQAVLAGLVVFVGLLVFGALVDRGARVENADFASSAANHFARIPAVSKDVISELLTGSDRDKAWQQRFPDQSGFTLYDRHEATDDLLILSRYDGDRNRGVTELIDLNTGEVLHTYLPDIAAIKRAVSRQHQAVDDEDRLSLDIPVMYRPDEYAMKHPFIEADGSILFREFHTPMVKMDACSTLLWTAYGAFHHALERDADGHYWSALRLEPPVNEYALPGYDADAVVQFSSDGDILFVKSVTEIFLENDMAYMVYPFTPYAVDPYHVNDVEPVLSDGPHWQKGDLLISMRTPSTVLLYRPSTNKILWHQRGPWMSQHDVDIVSDHEISVFNNNAGSGRTKEHEPPEGYFVVGTNETMIYDFETDQVTSPYADGYQKFDIRTPIEGLNRVLQNGDVWVEETRYGRLIVLDKAGNPKWTYVNRAANGEVYGLHWSRYLEGEAARTLRDRISQGFDCD